MRQVIVGRDIPPVYHEEGNRVLSAKKLGILHAMRNAVEATEPGVLILQDDIEVVSDLSMVKIVPGKITVLNEYLDPMHVCPRSFIIADEPTRERLLELWSNDYIQSCYSWRPIPKVRQNMVRVVERGVPD